MLVTTLVMIHCGQQSIICRHHMQSKHQYYTDWQRTPTDWGFSGRGDVEARGETRKPKEMVAVVCGSGDFRGFGHLSIFCITKRGLRSRPLQSAYEVRDTTVYNLVKTRPTGIDITDSLIAQAWGHTSMASFGCKCESQCLQASNVAKLSIFFALVDSLTIAIESWKYPLGMLYKHDGFIHRRTFK